LDVAKDVSAFANSGGGVIIYGVRTDVDKTLPVAVEGIESRNIETFDRIVNAHIRPEIPGLQRRVLIRDNLTLMVVHVPQSDEAPHQSLTDHATTGAPALSRCRWSTISSRSTSGGDEAQSSPSRPK
jgi:predicted HTH transcriptional regulator